MSNYKEQNIQGTITQWQRARQIILDNPHNSNPVATCYETMITQLESGDYIEKNLGSLNYIVSDASIEIPLVNLDTYEPSENTITIGEIWQSMASVYLWLARQRDAGS